MDYLLFRLYGPLASWGEIAIGESRHSAAYPGKSALLGLLAAALGIRRDEEERQRLLAEGYRFAVKVISSGYLLRDYHTTQVPDSAGKARYLTRREELVKGKDRLGTVLSSRENRSDGMYVVAVQIKENAPYTLHDLCDALHKPKFHLYLGRKSNPLAAPLNPQILSAEGFKSALDGYRYGPLYLTDNLLRFAERESPGKPLVEAPSLAGLSREDGYALNNGKKPACYYWEGETTDLTAQQILTRHDQPLSRARWQFTQRVENMFIEGRAE